MVNFSLLFYFQSTRTVLNSTKLENESAVFIPSILTVSVPLMYFVTKKQPVGGGQCSKRDWTARLISTAAGMTTNAALEIWTENFGSDWTRFTGWQNNEAGFEWTLKKSTGRQHMPSTTTLVSLAREINTGWVLEHTLVHNYLTLPSHWLADRLIYSK